MPALFPARVPLRQAATAGVLALAFSASLLPAAALAGTEPTGTPSAVAAVAAPDDKAVAEARAAREQAERQVAVFQAQVEQATAVLTEGSRRLERQQAELALVQQRQTAANKHAEQALALAEAARERLATIAVESFLSPVPDTMQLALTTGPHGIRDAVVARADLDRVRGSSQDAMRESKAARVEADAAVRAAAQLSQAAAAKQAEVAAEVESLRATAEQNRRTLSAAADALAAARRVEQVAVGDATARAAEREGARRAAETALQAAESARRTAAVQRGVLATCTDNDGGKQANGFLDPGTLCPLDDAPGHALRPQAAAAFNALNAAHKAERGRPLCVTDSYRSYAAQVDIYARKPHLAAVPGTSNHGWGLAVDFCDGVERFGTDSHLWMRANAGRFGWFHPAWAQQNGSRPEAWHWEYPED